ncbi:MAG: HDOD domain-containing protein [Rhizobiales bacterium]|nr:HDOD domain-containing protein [Rhizobacter sp.]
MSRLDAEAVAASVRDLPALPAVVMELIQSLGQSDISAEQLADKISHDQALAAKTLRLANSSFYGMSRQVTSIAEATAILGLRTLRSVATAAGLAGAFSAKAFTELDFKAFWRHSIGTALCARSLARTQRLDEDTAFVVGLLHDIGRLALASNFPVAFAEALAHQHTHDCPAFEAEQAVLGTDHTVVGGLIAEHWRFTPGIVEAIVQHHRPARAAPGSAATMADLVNVADNMAHALDLSHLDSDMVPPISMDAWLRLALDEARCRDIFQRVEAQHESVCQALSV